MSRHRPIVDLPDDLAARMGAGWSVGLEDTLGEFQLKLWLANAAGGVATNQADATKAAAGWGGDRVAVLDGPGGATAVVIRSEWDTASDARSSLPRPSSSSPSLSGSGDVLAAAGGTRVTVVLAPDAGLVSRLESVLGSAD